MVCELGLILGKGLLFGHMKMLQKAHAKWTSQDSTYFTNIISVQKLEIILVVKLLDEMMPNWVERCFIGIRMIW